MKFNEMMLEQVSEECAEIIQAVSKVNRFGPDAHDPRKEDPEGLFVPETNMKHLMKEFQQLISVWGMCEDSGAIRTPTAEFAEGVQKEKRAKVVKHLRISHEIGTLEELPEEYTYPCLGASCYEAGNFHASCSQCNLYVGE